MVNLSSIFFNYTVGKQFFLNFVYLKSFFLANKNFIEIIKNDPQFGSINDIYIECFETEFLREAQDFYLRQEIPSFEPNQMLEYLTSVNYLR